MSDIPPLGGGSVMGGAFAISPYGILPVYGMPIKINPVEHDIQQMAEVTNLNFHCYYAPSVLSVGDLPGPMLV